MSAVVSQIQDESPWVEVRRQGGVATLSMNRGAQFNALSSDMIAALQTELDALAADAEVRVVVLAGAGRAFCAGHDLREMRAAPSEAFYQKLFAQCTRMMRTLQAMPQPVIARVHGLATAAGCQLVATCDLAVAAEGVRFGVNGIDVGLFCATPSVPLSRNMQPKQAMEMLLTGGFIDAAEAQRRGLVNRVVSAEALDTEVESLLQAILAKPRIALAMGKRLFYEQAEMGIEAAYQLAGQTMACNMIDAVAQEGVQAFIDKREPSWPS